MISEGTSASVGLLVAEGDTAIALGSGDVAVLGTPRVVALGEEAAVAAIAGALPDGTTSVGTTIELDHLAATAVGRHVTAKATVTGVDGKRVSFAIAVEEGDTMVARGTHERFIVDRERFEASLSQPA